MFGTGRSSDQSPTEGSCGQPTALQLLGDFHQEQEKVKYTSKEVS